MKLIAEPWDASMDGYQVGSFPPPWVEWNDRYRDTVRDFWREGTAGIREISSRLAGSSDLYADDGRSPYSSVNFVTAHDGFTLRDLVSYNQKHNEANGERNRDGSDNNRSWNCGVEGETDDEEIIALRHRQAANLMVTLCLSSGAPMLTAGDERGRTQRGNNNAYVQDNEVSWIDWRPGRRVARPLRGHQGRAPAAPRAPGAAAAAPLRRHPHHRGRPQGPGLAAPVRVGRCRGRTGTTTSCTSSACSCPATRSAPPARAASSSATRRS